MVSFRSLLAVAPLLATALAGISLTNYPTTAVAGSSYNISWTGGDDSAVTLILRQGDPQNLNTVNTITSQATGSSYTWTVPSSIVTGDDYALEIDQGSDVNYSGLFSISGTSANSTSSASAAVAASTTAMYSNSTMAITSAASAAGTGTVMSRNSTFSSATLTASNSTSFTMSSATRTSSSSSSASKTASATSSVSTAKSEASLRTGASSAALILGIVAAVLLH